jgi:hypothetical protein
MPATQPARHPTRDGAAAVTALNKSLDCKQAAPQDPSEIGTT